MWILLSSWSESDLLCEMSSEWTPTPQPRVVDSGAAETVENLVPKPQDSRIRRIQAWCVLHDGRRAAALWRAKEI